MPIWRRTIRNFSITFIVFIGTVLGPVAAAEDKSVEPEDLSRGLVAVYRDTAEPAREVWQLEPTIALALKAGESPHPRLSADGGSARWQGYINLVRAGEYRFTARLRGRFRLRVAGKEVLAGESRAAEAALVEGPPIRLAAGVQTLSAEFTGLSGSARLEVSWQASYFRSEPLPYDYLGHLPTRVPARLGIDHEIERGRFLAEERGCATCHQPAGDDRMAKGLLSRQGPDLSQVGQRAYAGWLMRWLEAPRQVRPGAVMPQLFSPDEAGRVERYCVTTYLTSLGGPLRPQPAPSSDERQGWMAHGQRLFATVGCVVCHGTLTGTRSEKEPTRTFYGLASPDGSRTLWRLRNLGSQTTPEKLAAYLVNPLAVDPGGRMPNMLLGGDEARTLGWYLCQQTDPRGARDLPAAPGKEAVSNVFRRVEKRPEQTAAFQRLAPAAQHVELGKRLVVDKGCNHCHTIAPGGQPFASVIASASFDDVKNPRRHTRGCLADEPSWRDKAPWFELTEADRRALRLFLKDGTSGAGAAAPGHAGRAALERFNCLACHQRDGEGGLTPALTDELRRYEKAENAEAVSPPPLTGVGHKLRTPWVRQVLTGAARARPWMGLRMPQFGEAHVGQLPEAFVALEGTAPQDQVDKVPLTVARIEQGRQLVSKKALGCVSCHDIAGVANTGTRGPDLAAMDQRVRYDWYRRWLEQAQRIQPRTRMPVIFPEGKSLLSTICGGQADAQAAAMWAYLALGSSLPLPEGLEPPGGLVLTVTDRPVLVRTFMPDASPRAMAVGYPGGVSAMFDAGTCRLAYAWSGAFLDAAGAWRDRGGSQARPLGPRFWTAPAGCPWAATASAGPPDFSAHARDPAYGAALAEGKLYDGPRHLAFVGYTTDAKGLPTFRYRLQADTAQPVEVSEGVEPLRSTVAAGFARRFTLQASGHTTPWLWAGECGATPRFLDGNKSELAPAQEGEVPAAGARLVLVQNDRAIILAATEAPSEARWHLHRHGGTWQVLLRLPALTSGQVKVTLQIWAPYSNDSTLWKDLGSAKAAPR
jgi:cytochrome c551/c552